MAEFTRRITDVNQFGEIVNRQELKSWDGWDKDGDGYYFRYRAETLKFYPDIIPRLDNLTLGKFIRLCTYMYPGTNLLAYRKKDKLKLGDPQLVPYTKAQLMRKLGMKTWDPFTAMWKKLKEENIVKKVAIDGIVYWAINPCACNSCKYVPYWLYCAFKPDMDRYLSTKVILKYGEIARANDCYVNNLDDMFL